MPHRSFFNLYVQIFKPKMAESDTTFVFKRKHRKALKDLLWPARTAYQYIYITLGFDPTELHTGPSGTSISDLYMNVVEAIINQGVSKQQLVDALKSPIVSHGRLALDLEENKNIKNGENGNLSFKIKS